MPKSARRLFHTPTSRRLDDLYAWVAEDTDKSEGLIGGNYGPDGQWMAFVGGDVERMRSLRPMAEAVQRQLRCPVRLVRFGMREDLEELR